MIDLDTHRILKKASILYVACSGGLDSMVLLDVLRSHSYPIHVLHMNYKLRGSASDADAQLVQTYCTQHQIPLSIKTLPLKKQLEKL